MRPEVKWIRSAGGPLICVEDALASSWHGTDLIAKSDIAHSETDYARACHVRDYLGTVEILGGSALILGDMPLETTVWRTSFGDTFIVRLFYMDPGTDVTRLLGLIDEEALSAPDESIIFRIKTGSMVLFDSAISGADEKKEAISFGVSTGTYRIVTKVINPDSRTSFLIHKFYLEM